MKLKFVIYDVKWMKWYCRAKNDQIAIVLHSIGAKKASDKVKSQASNIMSYELVTTNYN